MISGTPAWLERWPIAYVHPHKLWTVTDTRRWGVVIPETGAVREVDPSEDPCLPGLASALDRGRLVGYRYGRRAVVATQSSYIKVVRPSRVSRFVETMEAVAWASRGVSTPAIRAASADGQVELSIVGGSSLHGRLRGESAAPLEQVGRLLATFHRAQLARPFAVRTPDEPERWTRIVTRAEPRYRSELADVAASLPHLEMRSDTVVHGDLHDKNVLLSEHRLGLIDFDAVGLGGAEDDLANLGVHIELRGAQAGVDASTSRCRAISIYRGYAEQRTLDWERIDAVERHTWFRLACLYRYRRASRRLTATMLGRCAGEPSLA